MYHALIENALQFLSTFKRDSNKTRDLYKRLELALRADGPRLTAMRRITPLEFAVWIKQVEDFARDGRPEALNSFYGHTVVREPKSRKGSEKPKETPTPTPKISTAMITRIILTFSSPCLLASASLFRPHRTTRPSNAARSGSRKGGADSR